MISRSSGTTDSERFLAELAERTFLNLWSYPNLFYDKRATPNGDGKELCDLLVVCGDNVLIFSCKTITWPAVDDGSLAWRRWFKRAVQESVAQILGAQRWLREFPERIFLDSKCSQTFPLTLPPLERRKVHGIVVAEGAEEACKQFYGGGLGSFILAPSLLRRRTFQRGLSPVHRRRRQSHRVIYARFNRVHIAYRNARDEHDNRLH
jgi:hypothetical protein